MPSKKTDRDVDAFVDREYVVLQRLRDLEELEALRSSSRDKSPDCIGRMQSKNMDMTNGDGIFCPLPQRVNCKRMIDMIVMTESRDSSICM